MPASIINKKFKRSFRLCSIPKGSFFVRFYLSFNKLHQRPFCKFRQRLLASSATPFCEFFSRISAHRFRPKNFSKSIDFTRFLIDLTKKTDLKGDSLQGLFSFFSCIFCSSLFFYGDNGFCEKYAISTCEMTTFLFPLGVFIQTLNICIQCLYLFCLFLVRFMPFFIQKQLFQYQNSITY